MMIEVERRKFESVADIQTYVLVVMQISFELFCYLINAQVMQLATKIIQCVIFMWTTEQVFDKIKCG